MKADKLTNDVRRAEREIDNCYQRCEIIKYPFAIAAWGVLAVSNAVLSGRRPSGTANDVMKLQGNTMEAAVTSMQWIYQSCANDGKRPVELPGDLPLHVHEMMLLALNYWPFTTAYTLGSRGYIDMSIEGDEIVTSGLGKDSRYEAYTGLLLPLNDGSNAAGIASARRLILAATSEIDGPISREIADPVMAEVIPIIADLIYSQSTLPDTWSTSNYTYGDFRLAVSAIGALALMSLVAVDAVRDVHEWVLMAHGPMSLRRSEWIDRISVGTGLAPGLITEIVRDLEFGSRGIRNPNILWQPLVPVYEDYLALSPGLFFATWIERGLTSLVNKIDKERDQYSRMVSEKEEIMRRKVIEGLDGTSVRLESGELPDGLPDIDLAIIDDVDKFCLIIEMKWFIMPESVVNVIDRGKDVDKGVSQMQKIREAMAAANPDIFAKLKVDSTYSFECLVVTELWIGQDHNQSPTVPVIDRTHLVELVRKYPTLREVGSFLSERRYLPTEGIHFEATQAVSEVCGWKLRWYGIKKLTPGRLLLL